jgi:hypothetical protein
MKSRTSGAKSGVLFSGYIHWVPDARMPVRIMSVAILALSLVGIASGQDDAVRAADATIQNINSTGRTIVVKTDDGIGHTLHVLDSTAVHGVDAGDVTAKDSWHGLKEGGEVIVRYTKTGTEETAIEIDKFGGDGFKATEGTVKEIDKGGKSLVVVARDGAEQTFKMTGQAIKETGTGIGRVQRLRSSTLVRPARTSLTSSAPLRAGLLERGIIRSLFDPRGKVFCVYPDSGRTLVQASDQLYEKESTLDPNRSVRDANNKRRFKIYGRLYLV